MRFNRGLVTAIWKKEKKKKEKKKTLKGLFLARKSLVHACLVSCYLKCLYPLSLSFSTWGLSAWMWFGFGVCGAYRALFCAGGFRMITVSLLLWLFTFIHSFMYLNVNVAMCLLCTDFDNPVHVDCVLSRTSIQFLTYDLATLCSDECQIYFECVIRHGVTLCGLRGVKFQEL